MTAGQQPNGHRPAREDLREWLAVLEGRGLLAHVTRTVNPVYEVTAVLGALDGQRAAIFENVSDSDFALVGNTTVDRATFALAVGCEASELARSLADLESRPYAITHPSLDRSELSYRSAHVDGIPICKHHEHDAGRYLTSGVIVARDARSGRANWSLNRLQLVDSRRFRLLVLPGNLAALISGAEQRGEDLEVAVLVGVSPLALLASQIRGAHSPVDGLVTYARLAGVPVEAVSLPGTDLEVPACSEVVIQGVIPSRRRELEGPFGEFARLYGPAAPGHVIEVQAVYARAGAIAQTILPGGREHLMLGGAAREAGLFAALQQSAAPARAVHFTPGGSQRFHAAIQLDGRSASAREAIRVALGYDRTLKLVVVVDEDVDIFDPEQLEWALATRYRPQQDTVVCTSAPASSLDPTARDGLVTKLGLDATRPDGASRLLRRFTNPLVSGLRLSDYVS